MSTKQYTPTKNKRQLRSATLVSATEKMAPPLSSYRSLPSGISPTSSNVALSSAETDEEPVTPTSSLAASSFTPVDIAVDAFSSSLPSQEASAVATSGATAIDKPLAPAVTVDTKRMTPTLPAVSRWCHSCGTIATPRWRYGPSGPSTLCNACYFRWKNQGMPNQKLDFIEQPAVQTMSDSVSRTSKQLPTKRISLDNDRSPIKRLKASDKLALFKDNTAMAASEARNENLDESNTHSITKPARRLMRSRKPLTSNTNISHSVIIPGKSQESVQEAAKDEKERNALLEEFFDATTSQLSELSVSSRAYCCRCHTKITPLWRTGPFGPGTLCNACGLKWAKISASAKALNNPPSATKRHLNKTSTEQHTVSALPSSTKITAIPTAKSFKPRIPHHILLRNRKEFIKHGMYHDETRTLKYSPFTILQLSVDVSARYCSGRASSMPTLFPPLPIHQGEFIIAKQRDFELPADILQERELGLIRSDHQPRFIRIRSNIFVERKPAYQQKALSESSVSICQCKTPPIHTGNSDRKGCGEDCLNRMLFYECDPKYCPCGDQCSNQRFQRKESKKGLQIFQTNSRGWGLRTLKPIKRGELIIEYRGEIISQELCEERMLTLYANEKNFYFLDYAKGEVIDACTKGTEARFINHSCSPNCHIEKWSFRGESHFGVFASQDIEPYSELFYDYNFSTFNGSVESQQPCYCGSSDCRGTIGKKSDK